jgi:hypothetical protein
VLRIALPVVAGQIRREMRNLIQRNQKNAYKSSVLETSAALLRKHLSLECRENGDVFGAEVGSCDGRNRPFLNEKCPKNHKLVHEKKRSYMFFKAKYVRLSPKTGLFTRSR